MFIPIPVKMKMKKKHDNKKNHQKVMIEIKSNLKKKEVLSEINNLWTKSPLPPSVIKNHMKIQEKSQEQSMKKKSWIFSLPHFILKSLPLFSQKRYDFLHFSMFCLLQNGEEFLHILCDHYGQQDAKESVKTIKKQLKTVLFD